MRRRCWQAAGVDLDEARQFAQEADDLLADYPDDDRVQRMARWVRGYAGPTVRLRENWGPMRAAAYACPSCERLFSTISKAGRVPQHGPLDARCPGSREPALPQQDD
jgi:hypothetical protein